MKKILLSVSLVVALTFVCVATMNAVDNELFSVETIESITNTESGGTVTSTVVPYNQTVSFNNCVVVMVNKGCDPLPGGSCQIKNESCSGGMILEVIKQFLVQVILKLCKI